MTQQIQSDIINDQIPNGWIETTLGYILEKKGYIRGPFGSALKRDEMLSEGTPVYEQQNAIYNHRIFRFFINEAKHKELSRFTVKENDLIVSCSGTLGRVSIIKKGDPLGIISQALLILRPDIQKINPKYLFNFFNSKVGFNALVSRSTGSVQVNLAKREIIEGIDLFLPPLPEQQAIASLLSSFDKKIELLREENKTLEQTAQTIFQEWFGKYGVGNLINANEILEFEKGIEVGSDNYFDNKNNLENPAMFYRVGDIANNGSYSNLFCETELLKNKYFNKHDVLVSFDGTVGRVFVGGYGGYSSGMRKIFTKNKQIKNSFIYFWAKSQEVQNTINLYSEGTTIQHAGKAIPYLQIISDEEKICKIQDILNPFFEKILSNIEQIRSLSQTRDELLPRLMKGEVRVDF